MNKKSSLLLLPGGLFLVLFLTAASPTEINNSGQHCYALIAPIEEGGNSSSTGWDNRVSSARGYSNCNYFYHYQNTSYGGTSVVCNTDCSSMGSLDNATSSEKWTYTP